MGAEARGPLLRGEALPRLPGLGVDSLRSWFAGFGGSLGYEVRDLEVTVGGDLAYGHSLNRMWDPGRRAGSRCGFRATYCLRKVDGRWLIAHEHTSTPFYMDGSFLGRARPGA